MTKKREIVFTFTTLVIIGLISFFPWISTWGLIFASNLFSCNQAFLNAVESENISSVEDFVKKGYNANCVDYRPVVFLESAKSPLSIAAKKKNIELMKYLIEAGAEPEDVLLGHYSVPVEAIPFLISKAHLTRDDLNVLLVSYAKRPDIAKILIEKGVDVNARISPRGWINKYTSTPLYQASENSGRADHSYPEGVKFLLDNGADPNLPGAGGNVPLSAAAVNRNPEVIKALIEGGANINQVSECGFPPLIIAAAKGYPDNIKIMLEAGADPNTRDNRNRASDDCLRGNQLMLQARGKRLDQETADHRREVLGIIDTANIQRQLKHQTSPEMASYAANRAIDGPYDGTALMWAAYSCDPESVSLLLEKGADINARDAYGATALMWGYACDNRAYERVVPLLLKAGADPSAKDAGGKTAKEYLPNSH